MVDKDKEQLLSSKEKEPQVDRWFRISALADRFARTKSEESALRISKGEVMKNIERSEKEGILQGTDYETKGIAERAGVTGSEQPKRRRRRSFRTLYPKRKVIYTTTSRGRLCYL